MSELSPYSRIKKENPKLHHEISDIARSGVPRAMGEIRMENIEPERMLPLEHSLHDFIGELRSVLSTVEHRRVIKDSANVRELIDDSLACLENIRLIRELNEMQKSNNPLGYDPTFIQKAVESAKRQLPVLANRIDAFSFPGMSRHAWNGLRLRLRPNVIVALAALGIALSPMEAENPGLETFSPLAAYRTLGQPEMHQRGTEPGKFEQGGEIARVRGNLPDFFATQIYEFDDSGKRVPVPLHVSHASRGLARGTISLPAVRYEKNAPVPLILPLGYVAQDLQISPAVPITLAPDHFILTEHSRGPLRVTYEVAPTEKTPYPLAKGKKDPPLPTLPEVKKLLADIAASPDTPEFAVHQYLQDFSYVVSSELQEMIDRIPGSMEYKTTLIKAGDCDVLADHLAYALKKHIPAGVAKGFWNADRDDILHAGEGHARLVYNTKDGLLKAIETTDHPKRAFVNLAFLPEDRALLEQKIREIERVPQKQKEAQIRVFGQTLEQILKKDEYLSFRPKGGLASALSAISSGATGQGREASKEEVRRREGTAGERSEASPAKNGQKAENGLWDAVKNFQGFDDWKLNLGLIVLLEALVLAGIGIGTAALYQKLKRQTREGNFRKDIDLFEDLDRGDLAEGSRKGGGMLDTEFRDLCYEFSIPQETADRLSGEEREIVVLLHEMRDSEKFFLISQLLASGRIKTNAFRKTLNELAQSQESVTREDILNTIRDVCESEKTRSVAEAAQARAVDRIWNIVRNYHLSQIENRTEEEQLGDILDTGPTVDGGKASRRSGSDEFHQLRSYVRGDDPRYMARRRSAADEPLVRELRAGMSGKNKQSFHLVVDLPSVDDWEVANLMHLLALAYKKKDIAIHGIDLYAFGVPIQQLDIAAMRKLIDSPKLNIDGFKKLVDVIVAGRVRESIHVASRYTGGVNTYSGSMLPAHVYEPLSKNHTVVYLGDARNVTTIRHIVRMKARDPSPTSVRSDK
jgi:hypothetical protein